MAGGFSMPPDAPPPGGSDGPAGGEEPKTSNQMTEEEQAVFFAIADKFLAVANDAANDVSAGSVSAAMMFACARFNAFTAQVQGMPPGEVDDDAIAYFRDEYVKMLRENMAQTLISKG
ncbi:MAG: DUF3144 domain-containing protein [Pseudomonadota bacterium]